MTVQAFTLALAFMVPSGTSQTSASESASIDRLEQAVLQLSSPDFQEREWASRSLMGEDESTLGPLQDIYARVENLEVRSRLQEIVKSIIFREAMANLGGFLGIHLLLVGPESEPALDDGQHAIRVQTVVPGTAAHQADLREGDLITELDGESFDLEFTQIMFINRIKEMHPGTIIDLQIIRDGQPMPATVELGVRPLHKLNTTNGLTPDQLFGLQDAARRFAEWCSDAETNSAPKSRSPGA